MKQVKRVCGLCKEKPCPTDLTGAIWMEVCRDCYRDDYKGSEKVFFDKYNDLFVKE